MNHNLLSRILTVFIAMVWLVNGLVCKLLGWVPRHEEIIGSILGDVNSHIWTIFIGIAEIAMAIWVLSKYRSKLNAITQIGVILIMNVIEIISVPEFLLWGELNLFFALFFSALIYCNEFLINKKVKE